MEAQERFHADKIKEDIDSFLEMGKIPKGKILIYEDNKPVSYLIEYNTLNKILKNKDTLIKKLQAENFRFRQDPRLRNTILRDPNMTQALEMLLKVKGKFHFFDDISNEEIISVVEDSVITQHKKGEVLFLEGNSGDEIYFIIKGKVRIDGTIKERWGRARTLAILSSKNIFGEISFATGEPRTATAIIDKDNTAILKFSLKKEYDEHHSAIYARIFKNIIQALSTKLKAQNEKMKKS